MKTRSILFCICLLLLSCCADKEELIGKWDDNIHLSTKSVELGSGAESATITTKGKWWWINAIAVNGTIYQYFDSEEVNLELDSYIITEDAFTFERRNSTTLIISLPENTSAEEVKMSITLQAGNYFDYVNIIQAAQ